MLGIRGLNKIWKKSARKNVSGKENSRIKNPGQQFTKQWSPEKRSPKKRCLFPLFFSLVWIVRWALSLFSCVWRRRVGSLDKHLKKLFSFPRYIFRSTTQAVDQCEHFKKSIFFAYGRSGLVVTRGKFSQCLYWEKHLLERSTGHILDVSVNSNSFCVQCSVIAPAALIRHRVLNYLSRQVKFYSLSFPVIDIKRLFQGNKLLYYIKRCSFTEYVS